MKRLNPIQIAASASGAVLSALIASVFGVSGTVIGVAVGSVVATTVTALVWESIERTHSKVRDAVVQKGPRLPLVHRWATRGATEEVEADARSTAIEASVDAGSGNEPAAGNEPATGNEPAAGNVPARAKAAGASDDDGVGETRLVAWSRATRTQPMAPAGAHRPPMRKPRWPLVVTIAASFALALGLVTLVEVLGGRPLSSLIGASNSSGGTSAGNLLTSTPPEASPTTSSTTAPPRPATTTSPSTSTTTTTTTSPSTSTTTTTSTSPSTSTTTTTTTTTATTPGAPSAASGGASAPAAG